MELPSCCALTLAADGATCLFGCGTVVNEDGMCPRCRDHSANRFECDSCLREWEDWGDGWLDMTDPAKRERTVREAQEDVQRDHHFDANYKPGASSDFPF